MENKQLVSGVMYSVVGRYMEGSNVTGYHLYGDDTQVKVDRDHLIYLVAQGVITNCRVQIYRNEPILRGRGINLNTLEIYDEVKGAISGIEQPIVDRDNEGSLGETHQVQKYTIVARMMHGSSNIGYIVKDENGNNKPFSRAQTVKFAECKQITNACIRRVNGLTFLCGAGVDLSKLPVIKVDDKGKIKGRGGEEEVEVEEEIKENKIVEKKEKVEIRPEVVEVTQQELMIFGKKYNIRLNKDAIAADKERMSKKIVGLEELKVGKARLYVQVSEEGSVSLTEYVSVKIIFGKDVGVAMRVMNRQTSKYVDIKQRTLQVKLINEKILLGILCCAIGKMINVGEFWGLSVQANDATSERSYKIQD